MTFLTSKHTIVAMLVAPVLAIMGYFALDFFVGETPHAAEEGQSYKLVEKPNCRYNSGNCGLKNGDFELKLNADWLDDNRLALTLKSEFPLEGVLVALVEDEADEKRPVEMRPVGDDGLVWSLDMNCPDPESNRLQVVASSGGALYFGDAAMKFSLYETTLN